MDSFRTALQRSVSSCSAHPTPPYACACARLQLHLIPSLHFVLRAPSATLRVQTDSNFGFRLNYYPPVDPDAAAQGAGRMLAHEDVDLFTLLPAGSQDGLQVLNRSNMKWVRLNAPEGSIIFNAGDYLQRITNDGEASPQLSVPCSFLCGRAVSPRRKGVGWMRRCWPQQRHPYRISTTDHRRSHVAQ